MAAPVTIKKRKKTIKAKAPSAAKTDAQTPADDADSTVSSEPFPDDTPSSEPFTAQPPVAAPEKPKYTLYAILAALATAFFIALLVIQWIEWTDYVPHFPRPIQTDRIVTPPS